MPAWDDLDVFLSLDDFAVAAVLHLASGSSRSVNVLFDDPTKHARLGDYNRDQMNPTAFGKLSDFAGVHARDTIAVEGATYDILAEPMADGNGMATLELRAQAK